MHKQKILLSIVAALLVIVGVAAAQATFTLVTGTETIFGVPSQGEVRCQGATPTGNPFMPCPPGTNGTVRGAQWIAIDATNDLRLDGINHIAVNANFHADGTAEAWGTFRIEVTGGGVWEGTYEGKQAADGTHSIRATGHGSGGSIEGSQLLDEESYPAGSPIGSITARILAPGK